MDPPSNEHNDRPTQFSLRWIFGVTTGIAFLFGSIHWLGLGTIVTLVTVLLLVVAAVNVAMHYKRFAATVGMTLMGLMAFGCLMSILSERDGRSAARRSQCTNNLKQIGIALHGYADDYGCFPPAYIADAEGRQMHSWRVLILPYMGYQDLYRRYDFGEPWDGPNNQLLRKEVPLEFQCPSDALLPRTAGTGYVAITGPQTIWPDDGTVSFGEISDGTYQTLAVVEVAHSGINWMEPRDLPFSALNLGVNSPAGRAVSSEHPDIAQVLFCDGSVRALEPTLLVKTLKALATKSGCEKIDEEY
ncbi:MAG TPA: DUF1559 domain-containing protein [Pirellulales bacterium]|nr:DUF1559 domain-containing protein [Pirellulales bacterium]